MAEEQQIRINKYLTEAGFCSRRETAMHEICCYLGLLNNSALQWLDESDMVE